MTYQPKGIRPGSSTFLRNFRIKKHDLAGFLPSPVEKWGGVPDTGVIRLTLFWGGAERPTFQSR
tara:strand:- start:1170 stop:1361 length:192 start_codon:yes stop_codon:yes gene_type:complete